jgi:transcriptional regulator with XRE-family HTH domain
VSNCTSKKKRWCIVTGDFFDLTKLRLEMENFAKRLKDLRKSRGLSQSKLAEMVEVTPRVYNRWERGSTIPRLDTIVKIADVLQVSLDELAGRTDLKSVEFKVRNPKLHALYKEIDQLSNEDQTALVVLLDSLIKRSQINKVLTK